jgi:predicted nuclease of predicted toxin-antitoxin system
MKVLVDAQLPQKLALLLAQYSIDAIHTLELPEQNRTSDNLICDIADQDGRIVIRPGTKIDP